MRRNELSISPSVLASDFSRAAEALTCISDSGCNYVHLDVMDGHFVPNISFGPDILKAFKKSIDLFMDVHIMVSDPIYYSKIFIEAGAQMLTFHYEAIDEKDILALVKDIKKSNCQAGISIKPKTPVEKIIPYLKDIDLVLVMSVEPGFGGQKFDESALDKIKFLADYKKEHQLDYLIEVDGGINDKTARLCKEKGVEVLVAGSYIFKNDIVKAVDSLC